MIELLILELGFLNNTFKDDAKDEIGYKFRVGYENVYLWGSEEEHEIRLLGQGIANTTVTGVGLGINHNWDEFYVFVEGGWGFVDLRPYDQKQFSEVNYTYLVGRHAVGNRRIPLDCADSGCYGTDSFQTEYSLDDAFMTRIGVDYQVINHVKISASYRWMQAEEYIAIYDQDRYDNNTGHWEDQKTRNMSAVEIGILFTW